ncbi:MAG: FtsQ-type POTRA domain-containing protein [Pseudomonadota bacterium]
MSKRALEQQRQVANQAMAKQWSRKAVLLTAIFLSFSAAVLVTMDQLMRPDAFVIDQLKITGSFKQLEPALVEQQVIEVREGNFFTINLDAIQQKVESLSWVDQAMVRREWPNTLLVSVKEHRPIMRLNKNAWVNVRGEVVHLEGYQPSNESIRLYGEADQARSIMVNALQWSARLKRSGLTTKSLTLSKSGAWQLELAYRNGLEEDQQPFKLLLGRENLDVRLTRFEQVFDRRFRFAQERLIRVDARYPDGLSIDAEPLTTTAIDSVDGQDITVHRSESMRFVWMTKSGVTPT